MTFYNDPKRNPIVHFEDENGEHLYSKPVTPEEGRQWLRARSHLFDESIDQRKQVQSASKGIDHVQLWTTQEDSAPTIAYLVAPNLANSASVPCLRIQIKVKQKDLNQNGIAVAKPVVHLEIGYCPPSLLARCPAKISTKQTAKKNWLAAIWKKVQLRLKKQSIGHPTEGAFTLIETLRTGEIDKQSTVSLIMMMYSEFWERGVPGVHTDESKKSDIEAFGIADQPSRSAFGTKYRRMEFKVLDEG